MMDGNISESAAKLLIKTTQHKWVHNDRIMLTPLEALNMYRNEIGELFRAGLIEGGEGWKSPNGVLVGQTWWITSKGFEFVKASGGTHASHTEGSE